MTSRPSASDHAHSLPPRAARRTIGAAAVPILAGAIVAAFGVGGALGRFQVGLTVLAVAAASFAFLSLTRRQATAALAFGSVLAGLLQAALGASIEGALAACALTLGTGLAAWGLAALGRALGSGPIAAGAIALSVVAAGLTGLGWADAVAQGLPSNARWGLRQAVLHLDAATALAYDAAAYDRLLAPQVYASVPLASSSFERPGASRTAALWGGLGLLAAAAAWGVRALGARGVGRRISA